MATASAKLHARLATVKAAPVEEPEEYDADYAGPEPQFDAARALGPRLSVHERERMLSMKRRAADDDGEVESHPLPAHLKVGLVGQHGVTSPRDSRGSFSGTWQSAARVL